MILVRLMLAMSKDLLYNNDMLLRTATLYRGNNKMKQTSTIRKFNLETKQGKLFKALVLDREVLTPAQMSKRFGIKNPTATVSDIRSRGYAIYANTRKSLGITV